MNIVKLIITTLVTALVVLSTSVFSQPIATEIDDFSQLNTPISNLSRVYITDASSGGNSQMESNIEDGILKIKGDLLPARGQPGWASAVLPLAPLNQPLDASPYQGLRLRVKVTQGMLSVSANSTDVRNFDYHASLIAVPTDGEFHEVDIPFKKMKRAWSEQTKLNTSSLSSISVVAFSLNQDQFAYELDSISFY